MKNAEGFKFMKQDPSKRKDYQNHNEGQNRNWNWNKNSFPQQNSSGYQHRKKPNQQNDVPYSGLGATSHYQN